MIHHPFNHPIMLLLQQPLLPLLSSLEKKLLDFPVQKPPILSEIATLGLSLTILETTPTPGLNTKSLMSLPISMMFQQVNINILMILWNPLEQEWPPESMVLMLTRT